MNEELIKVPVVELVYRNNTKPSKRYKIVTAKDVHELLVSPFKIPSNTISQLELSC